MKLSDLKGKPVVSVTEANKLGDVDNVILDLSSKTVLGLLVKTGGFLHSRQAVLLSDVKAVGDAAVTIEDASQLNGQDKFVDLKDKPTGDALVGAKVVTVSGSELGSVSDLSLVLPQGQVSEIILQEGLIDKLRGREYFIAVSSIRSLGNHLIVVSDSEADRSADGETGA